MLESLKSRTNGSAKVKRYAGAQKVHQLCNLSRVRCQRSGKLTHLRSRERASTDRPQKDHLAAAVGDVGDRGR